MNKKYIGVCSNCGGRVYIPIVWLGVIPPVPICENCGATAAIGPVIPMNPRPRRKPYRRPSPPPTFPKPWRDIPDEDGDKPYYPFDPRIMD